MEIEIKLDNPSSHLFQGFCNKVFAFKVAVEEHVAAAPGAADLAPQGSCAPSGLIQLVHKGRADLLGHPLFVLPGIMKQSAEFGEVTLQ